MKFARRWSMLSFGWNYKYFAWISLLEAVVDHLSTNAT